MPDFKQLAEGEKPIDPERFILIEVIHEPAIGKQYIVTGKGLDPDRQAPGSFSSHTLAEARERALKLAQAMNMPIIYLSSGIARAETYSRGRLLIEHRSGVSDRIIKRHDRPE